MDYIIIREECQGSDCDPVNGFFDAVDYRTSKGARVKHKASGECPVCGCYRVVRKDGKMAKHTVEVGWRNLDTMKITLFEWVKNIKPAGVK